jgi:hypothetical protein
MDKTASSDKSILWNRQKCSAFPNNLDSNLHISARRNRQKKMKLELRLYTPLHFFCLKLFEKIPMKELSTNINYNLTSSPYC